MNFLSATPLPMPCRIAVISHTMDPMHETDVSAHSGIHCCLMFQTRGLCVLFWLKLKEEVMWLEVCTVDEKYKQFCIIINEHSVCWDGRLQRFLHYKEISINCCLKRLTVLLQLVTECVDITYCLCVWFARKSSVLLYEARSHQHSRLL